MGTRRTFEVAHPAVKAAAEPIKNPRRVIWVFIILLLYPCAEK